MSAVTQSKPLVWAEGEKGLTADVYRIYRDTRGHYDAYIHGKQGIKLISKGIEGLARAKDICAAHHKRNQAKW